MSPLVGTSRPWLFDLADWLRPQTSNSYHSSLSCCQSVISGKSVVIASDPGDKDATRNMIGWQRETVTTKWTIAIVVKQWPRHQKSNNPLGAISCYWSLTTDDITCYLTLLSSRPSCRLFWLWHQAVVPGPLSTASTSLTFPMSQKYKDIVPVAFKAADRPGSDITRIDRCRRLKHRVLVSHFSVHRNIGKGTEWAVRGRETQSALTWHLVTCTHIEQDSLVDCQQ